MEREVKRMNEENLRRLFVMARYLKLPAENFWWNGDEAKITYNGCICHLSFPDEVPVLAMRLSDAKEDLRLPEVFLMVFALGLEDKKELDWYTKYDLLGDVKGRLYRSVRLEITGTFALDKTDVDVETYHHELVLRVKDREIVPPPLPEAYDDFERCAQAFYHGLHADDVERLDPDFVEGLDMMEMNDEFFYCSEAFHLGFLCTGLTKESGKVLISLQGPSLKNADDFQTLGHAFGLAFIGVDVKRFDEIFEKAMIQEPGVMEVYRENEKAIILQNEEDGYFSIYIRYENTHDEPLLTESPS